MLKSIQFKNQADLILDQTDIRDSNSEIQEILLANTFMPFVS